MAASMPTYISLVSQATIIPYTALLVLFTQHLAMRTLTSGNHTLTSVQDVTGAWSGLAAAFVGMWRQLKSPSYILGMTQVTAYLACISALHVTTPSLFSVRPFTQSNRTTVSAISSLPLMTIYDDTSVQEALWDQADAFLQYQAIGGGSGQYISTIGLSNSTVYDVINAQPDILDVDVYAATANVTCGCIPDATAQLLESPANSWSGMASAVYSRYNFTFGMGIKPQAGDTYPGLYYMTSLNFEEQISDNTDLAGVTIPLGRNALFWTTRNVVDDNGQYSPTVRRQGTWMSRYS
ncbi:hypothetical protein DAEQUDRAFT_386080 [Daedalea quercina L-15889]|uniref:Uncharacterized protein n=1 Tax=Daedalea quercina L-15889 TaxID=1314783 RepID=A0A165P2C6_9APHY|nr:hypothetical protein DAEQUDRAFT_386080 [Daedalea quercina L-15889]